TGNLPAGLEATMDVEWAHALAPLARIVVIEDPNQDPASFPGSLAQSLQTSFFNGSEIASISYGVKMNPTADSAASATMASLTSQGFSIFAAAGDSKTNAPGASLNWPGSDPNVVSVGGTSLFQRPPPAFFFETYWEGPLLSSAYGPTSVAAPSWQRAVTNQSQRIVPDVAFDANFQTGVLVYLNGSWWTMGGTSLGAPAWAAIWALCRTDAQNLPSAPIALYKVAQSRFGPFAFQNPSHTLFDSHTGLGTPNVSELISALQSIY
ncbi:peptidase S8 and S53 subtilisin kexin sedolisin, partial [mine drainage metagenome]